jgi:hypothetical protein
MACAPSVRLTIATLAALLAACSGEERAARPGVAAHVELVRVDTLRDPTGNLIGRFGRVMIGPDSSVYLPIQYVNHVLRFDKRGNLLQRIGRNGNGPGEFSISPQDLVLRGDSLVFANLGGRTVSFFRASNGEYITREIVDGFPFSLAATPSHLFAGALSVTRGTVAGVWEPGRDSMRAIVPIPADLLRNPVAMRRWPVSIVTAVQDTVIIGFITSDELRVASATGEVTDSLRIPALRRRGVPRELDAIVTPVLQSRLAFFLFASLASLEQRPDGHLLAVHYDWFTTDSTDRPSVDGESITDELKVFATVVDRGGRRACIDTPIPTAWTSLPAITLHGNDLVVVGHLESDDDRPVVEMRRYRIDLSTCDWVPLNPARPAPREASSAAPQP